MSLTPTGFETTIAADRKEYHNYFDHFGFPEERRDLRDGNNRSWIKRKLQFLDPNYRGMRIAQILNRVENGIYRSAEILTLSQPIGTA